MLACWLALDMNAWPYIQKCEEAENPKPNRRPVVVVVVVANVIQDFARSGFVRFDSVYSARRPLEQIPS